MEAGAPMILPKGIVLNTTGIYGKVAENAVLPDDKIFRYWRVYNTTYRKLKDPTARRLENFWFRVWGSQRKSLSGATLAQLFEHISTGPSFVPLRGPANRWEGPETPRQNVSFPSRELDRRRGERDGSPVAAPAAALSCSATRAPPPSILKKTRGPSTSGPRPTARFATPHDSQEEAAKDSEGTSSGSTATAGIELKLAGARKKPTTPTKKFVASSTSRRRPLLPRRPSSQSSTGSEIGRDAAQRSSAGGGGLTIAEKRSSRDSGGERSVGTPPEQGVSEKSLGKRPARVTIDKKALAKEGLKELKKEPTAAVPQSKSFDDLRRHRTPTSTPTSHRAGPTSSSAVSTSTASSSAYPAQPVASTSSQDAPITRSQSHAANLSHRRADSSSGRMPPQGLVSAPVATMAKVEAKGTFLDPDGTEVGSVPLASPPGDDVGSDHGSLSSGLGHAGLAGEGRPTSSYSTASRASSILEARKLVPTAPSTSAPIPLARTHSQLTLLLEKEGYKRPRSKGGKKEDEGERETEEGG